ncbi:MAG: ATP-dependent dethiobiotin synthetase BioD [Verrucomicrobiota bacterium]
MPTLVIAGSNTDVGKTHVAAALARELSGQGTVQVVKTVETGIAPGGNGDVEFVSKKCDTLVAAHTLLRYRTPMAPVAAAALEGVELTLEMILERYHKLPPADCRLVEGAGGIASPLSHNGEDLRDLALKISADAIILVVEDCLGAITQARVNYAYAASSGIPVWLWLNEVTPQEPHIRASNREGIAACMLPLCACTDHGAEVTHWINPPLWLKPFTV